MPIDSEWVKHGINAQWNIRRPPKKNDVLTHAATWVDLEDSTLEGSNSVTEGQTRHDPDDTRHLKSPNAWKERAEGPTPGLQGGESGAGLLSGDPVSILRDRKALETPCTRACT